MKHATHDDIVKRLKRASGHLTKTIAMIEAERPCVDVAQQLHAVSRAIEQAKRAFIHDHIDHCLEGSAGEGADRADLVAEFKEISKYL
ncbi:metal-sensing transcriptional repressor [Breoghania sp.]|uniref:metal-sensing transcriptional repressor n=1 Tax=Breoghania sp. TaxID=2065378 RepID=UPI00262929B8|nr:metal-sensing transcriptional repressor [Breoghania sp.]MDJ0931501.1 metal-sensing transcriptional repressor [Breoghania sp.]